MSTTPELHVFQTVPNKIIIRPRYEGVIQILNAANTVVYQGVCPQGPQDIPPSQHNTSFTITVIS